MNKSQLAMRALSSLVGLVLMTGSLFGIDPDLPYNSGSTGADGPLTFREIVNPGRRDHCMVYDSVRQRLIVWGGWTDGVGYLNDTWSFDGANWTKIETATAPPGRRLGQMVFDPVRQKTLLFGGYRDANLNDTWTFDGVEWTKLTPATVPDPRYGAGIAFDGTAGRQHVVMFGGNGGADQTWIWDGTNWSLRTPAARPPGDSSPGFAYDAARQRVVLFHQNRQTWVWDGNNWANVSPATSPTARSNGGMAYDATRQEVVLYGGSDRNDTWIWNGLVWTERTPPINPGIRRDQLGFTYHPGLQRVVLHGGHIVGVDGNNSDTWYWNGTDWAFWSGKTQEFDMTSRASGIWNFTTGDVPPGVTVTFKKNAANTPVRWRFTRDVTIRGAVALDGGAGVNSLAEGVVAKGGPGGFDGGSGGIPFNRSSSFAGIPGQGPGGGAPGTLRRQDGGDGLHNQNGGYGNAFLQPLVGGSGGGGGGSTEDAKGGNGSGGGGAILIASSRDIIVSGGIRANGGPRQHSGVSWGGRGSGGGILLRADRISGAGALRAVGTDEGNDNGRIRLEAFDRNFSGSSRPGPVYSVPVSGPDYNQGGTLSITRIAGQNVQQPPGGSLVNPDVIFTQTGPVEITVNAVGIPDGTAVNLRVTTADGVVSAGPQFLASGACQFTLIVPAGTGSVQAFADYRVSN